MANCNGAYFVGTDDVTINQGVGIDLESGVYAFDSDGNELDFTYTPTSIDKCSVGRHTVTYRTKAIGNVTRPNLPCGKSFLTMPSSCDDVNVFTENRIVTITQAKPPKISGIGAVTIQKNTDFNPMSGVSAVDDNGNAVEVEYSGKYTQSLTGNPVTFEADESDGVKSLSVSLDPIQDLNGYSHPWVGGAGKNLLPYPYVGGSSLTNNGVTFTAHSDGSVTVNGTATANAVYQFTTNEAGALSFLPTGRYTVSGCPSGGSASTYEIQIRYNGTWHDVGANEWSFDYVNGGGGVDTVRIRVLNGQTVNNLKFYPMIRLASVSDATFEPYSNICPISGRTSVETHRTGRNLLELPNPRTATTSGITFTVNADGSVRVQGTATANAFVNLWNWIPLSSTSISGLVGQQLTLSGGESSAVRVQCAFRKNSGGEDLSPTYIDSGDGVTFTTPTSNSYQAYMAVRVTNGTTVDTTLYPQLELGSTATAYEPYQGETYTTDLGRTVYGGTLDVVSGVLTVDRAIVDLGSLSWTYATVATSNYFRSTALSGGKSVAGGQTSAICSDFETYVGAQAGFVSADSAVWVAPTNVSSNPYACIKDSRYTDATAFKTAMSGVQLCYELATPQTYQLTPQEVEALVGSNTVWSDGEVTVVFTQDIPQGETIQYASDGKYTITYSAEDECGNKTEQTRDIYVGSETFRTVLYGDYTLIINESSWDIEKNMAKHGFPIGIYAPYNGSNYHFSYDNPPPWGEYISDITSASIGSPIKPTDLTMWFEAMDGATLIDVSKLDTSDATVMDRMFMDCPLITSLDLSKFDTSKVTSMYDMFHGDYALQTIYASNKFVTTRVPSDQSLFDSCLALVGGSGTAYDNDEWETSALVSYARIDNPPTAPGYFTAR